MSAADIVGMAIALSLVALVLIIPMIWLISAIAKSAKTGKPFRCCLGLHKPDKEHLGYDGAFWTCKCKRCGEELRQGLRGDWF